MKKNKLNIYGDRGQEKLKMGYCGYDISSQRLDELDKETIQYVLSRKENGLNCIDLGCGEGKIGIILAMIGADVLLIDKNDISKKIKPIKNNFDLNLNFLCKNANDLEPEDLPFKVDVCYSQRFIHYLKFNEADKLIDLLSKKMKKGSMLFISASGLNSELGTGYRHKNMPIEKRFAKLKKELAKKHNIVEPVCLYAEADLEKLITPHGFKTVSVKSSDFGNIKGVFKKK